MNNYVSAGFLTLNVSTNILHARECTTELNMANNPDLTTGRVRFTITKADGSKLEGWCCPSNELSRL